MRDVGFTLTWRWTPLREHAEQRRFGASTARFEMASAGRRSGKTEIAKRKLVFRALNAHRRDLPKLYVPYKDPRFLVGAPTVEQARQIYWEDLKALVPANMLWGRPNESTMTIKLINGARIRVTGMDRPARAEGVPWDGVLLDEYADMREEVFSAHLEPMLAERKGWCWFVGVPEGRNHMHAKWLQMRAEEEKARAAGLAPDYECFTWPSADILEPAEMVRLRSTVDEVTFKREFEGSWESFANKAYYAFDYDLHCKALEYDPTMPVVCCFDFNIAPGVAVVCQEMTLPNGEKGTGVVGEVWIERGSNTPLVMSQLLETFKNHTGFITVCGDASGFAGGTMRLESDWELIRRLFHRALGSLTRVHIDVPKANPRERDRVNAMNSRLRAADGTVRLMVDPTRAPHVVEDFENTLCVKGGGGEIDKKGNPRYSHLCFSGNTLVETPNRGIIEIARLSGGGLVRGALGDWVHYADAGKTLEDAEMVDVRIEGGRVVRCTPWHEFLTEVGWVQARYLTGLRLASSSTWMAHSGSSGSGTRCEANTSCASMGHGCIESCGAIITEQSRAASQSTTSTTTGPTIRSRTSFLCHVASMHPCMRALCLPRCASGSWSDSRRPETLRPSGIEARRGVPGTQSTLRVLRDSRIMNRSVVSAEGCSRRTSETTNSALEPARWSTIVGLGATTRSVPAASAERFFACIVGARNRRAAVSAEEFSAGAVVRTVTPAPRADAYCLRVPEQGCFALADGTVVSNSDAIGYYVHRYFPVGKNYKPSGQKYWK